MHNGCSALDAVIITILDYFTGIIKKENIVFRKIYRAIAIGHAAVVANRFLQTLSDRQLDDRGVSRSNFLQQCMNKIIADFAAQDAAEANKAIRNMVDNMTNANLVGAV